MRRALPVIALLAVAGTLGPHFADAAKVRSWTDRNGVRHYSDHAPADVPAERLRTTAVPAQPASIAGLRTLPMDGGYRVLADNLLAGPVEVSLRFAKSRNIQSEPALPTRVVVPARSSALVATLGVVDPTQGGDYDLRMDAVPGDPRARALDVEYVLPLRARDPRIEQSFGGSFSHSDEQNRYALDLAAPIGTPVLAARDGTVMEVESDFARAGLDRERYGGRANMVRLLHDDGAMSVYAHLHTDGVLVRVGQRVRAGQQIGLSGNTGFTSGPHLHFAVQVNRGMRLESIPFRMRGPGGPMRLRGN